MPKFSDEKPRQRPETVKFRGVMPRLPYLVLAAALIIVIVIGIVWSKADIPPSPVRDPGSTHNTPAG